MASRESAAPPAARSLADKLNALFGERSDFTGTSLSNEDVAAAINSAGDARISGSYLWTLRTGKRDNPTRTHLQALASYFGVSPAYFFDSAEPASTAPPPAILRDPSVKRLLAAAAELSPASLGLLVSLAENAHALEVAAQHSADGPGAGTG